MGILEDTAEFFVDTIVIRRMTHDSWGVASGLSSVTVNARISNNITKVRGQNGQEVVSRLQATINSAPSGITTNSEFTLPARLDPRTPQAQAVGYYTDENGPLFIRVFF